MCVHLPLFIYCICTHVNLTPACEGLCVCVCVHAVFVLPPIHQTITITLWSLLFLHGGNFGSNTLPFLQFLTFSFFPPQSMPFSSLHPLPCSLSAGDPDVKGDWDRKSKGSEGRRGREIHIPRWQTSLSKTFLDKAFTDTYTQTIMHTKQWSPSRRQGPIVRLCIFPPYVCVFVCAHLMTKQSMNNILLEICCRYLAELFTGGSWPGMKLLFSFSGERGGNQYRPERAKQTVSNSCMPASPAMFCSLHLC